MRGYTLTTDMDFRVIPSAIPLQSPSPDRKSLNIIAPTLSPNTVDVKKGSTPIKNRRWEKENKKEIFEHETEYKYESHTPTSEYTSAMKSKDEMIRNLQNIINCITDSSRNRKEKDSDYEQLRSEVKILTIQNQKLVNIIEKMSKKNGNEGTLKMNEQQYQSKINELMKTMKQDESCYEQETKELKRLIKSLNSQCKIIEDQKNELSMENKKLLKILKQKNENEKKNANILKLSDASDNSNEQKSQTSNKSQQRLTLMKIRQQHSQNMKALKEGLIKQIESTFDTMKIAFDGINAKVLALGKRLESLETNTWTNVRRTHVETESIKISIREGANVDLEQKADRLEKKSNSEIYIEQGPASSHERASRDQFSRLEEVSSQKHLDNPLQEQLAAVKIQLNELRFKYQKMRQDCQSVRLAERLRLEEANLGESECKQKQELMVKNREISILKGQIENMEEQRKVENSKKDEMMREKQLEVEKIKQIHEEEIAEMQMEAQQKVRLLLQTYQNQIQLLKSEVQTKASIVLEINAKLNALANEKDSQKAEWQNTIINLKGTVAMMEKQKQESQKAKQRLNEKVQKYQSQGQQLNEIIREMSKKGSNFDELKLEYETESINLNNKIKQLESEKLDLEEKIKSLQIEFANSQENWVKLQKSKDHELQVSYETAQNNRKKRQEIEQETMIQISQISQRKIEIECLKAELIQKKQELEEQKQVNTKSEKQIELQQENSNNLRNLLICKQNTIVELRQMLIEWNNSTRSLCQKQNMELNRILNQ